MLEEWDERGGHGDELLGRDVHVIDAGGFDLEEIAPETDGDFFAGEIAVVVDGSIGLADEEGFLAVGGEELDAACDTAILDLAVRGLDEAELVDA